MLAIVGSEVESEAAVEFVIPGEVSGWGVRLKVVSEAKTGRAVLRNWKAGDRIRLRYSSGEKKVKVPGRRFGLRLRQYRRRSLSIAGTDGEIPRGGQEDCHAGNTGQRGDTEAHSQPLLARAWCKGRAP